MRRRTRRKRRHGLFMRSPHFCDGPSSYETSSSCSSHLSCFRGCICFHRTMVPMSGPAPRRRVLAVEDDPAIRELMRMHLALAGLHVEEVADGREALERARAEAFDLIVLDLMLPTLDGITVCRAIRTEGANRATPILMVTARDTEADTVIGLESGADDYLAKPLGVREFIARVGAVMRR